MKLFAKIRPTSCCGLVEWHGLQLAETPPMAGYGDSFATLAELVRAYPGRAVFATTTVDQEHQVKELKRLGFKKVDKWRNGNTGRVVTFWFYQPNKSRRKKNVPE